MVVLIVDELDVGVDEPKCHAPVAVDPDRVVPGQVAFEPMGPKRRDGQILNVVGYVEGGQDAQQLGDLVGLDAHFRAVPVQLLESFVPEANDHSASVSRAVTRYNPSC